MSEFFVVAQEEDGIFQGQSVVKVTLGLAFCCAFHLEIQKRENKLKSVCMHICGVSMYKLALAILYFLSIVGLTFSNSARKLSRVSSDSLPTSNMVTA